MTPAQSIQFMLTLPWVMGDVSDEGATYDEREIETVLDYARQIEARAEAAEAERDALRELVVNLSWRQSLPTAPGWYWLKKPHENEPQIVYVRLYVNDLAIGNSKIAGWPSLERSLWAGPIPDPGK